jgi:hypothetical protein
MSILPACKGSLAVNLVEALYGLVHRILEAHVGVEVFRGLQRLLCPRPLTDFKPAY